MRAPALPLLFALAACAPLRVESVQQVPELDAQFRSDPRFIGADSAYSVALPDGRVLWLFGDTFVATNEQGGDRRAARMVRNSIALQQDGAMTFPRPKDDDGGPASFFAEPSADLWLWPGGAAIIDGKLLVFLVEVARAEGGLGFATQGTRAVLIDDPGGDPLQWTLRPLDVPTRDGIALGFGAVLVHDDHVVCFSPREPGDHAIFAARYPVADAAAGDLSAPEWLTDGAWSVDGAPTPLWSFGQTEFSVHFEPALARFVAIEVDGFGATNVVARTAERLEGPWSGPVLLFRPAESDRGGPILVYSAKAHPELSAPREGMIVTYNTNTTDFGQLIDDQTLYFPRAVRVRVAR